MKVVNENVALGAGNGWWCALKCSGPCLGGCLLDTASPLFDAIATASAYAFGYDD